MHTLKRVPFLYLAILSLLVSSGVITGPPQVLASVPAAEKNALTALYNATNGPAWLNNDGWDDVTRPDPCEDHWYRVVCDSTLTHVTQLNLPGNNLIGFIPASLGALSRLEYLALYDNDLGGSIPSSLGNLQYLSRVDLRSNNISGVIPSSLGNMKGLQYLALRSNNLSGEIPSSLGNLLQLRELWLDNNELCGIVPSSLTNLTLLEDNTGLYLRNNKLITQTGPALAAFIIQKSGSDYWTRTQNSQSCFFWPDFLPAITHQ